MPKTTNQATTSPSAVEEIAAVPFKALDAGAMEPPPTLAAFMESAGGTFNVIRLGFAMLTKAPDELVEVFRSLGDGAALQFATDVSDTKEWVASVGHILDAIETRTWIAACRLAVEG
jgi:hypothetical protein